MLPPEQRRVTCYGLDRSVTSWVVRPESAADVVRCVELARERRWSICPAGGRNSFGDVFLLRDHLSVDLRGLDRILAFDAREGTITVEAGALERAVLAHAMAAGWQLSAASGSLWNTVGGNLSSNINGKDSWQAGTFGDQVVSFRITLADGSEREVDRGRDPELFGAVMGGLGLLGIVTEVTLRLRRIPSVTVARRSHPVADAGELTAAFAGLRAHTEPFAYAWVDPYARGRGLGRGVFETACFVETGAPAVAGDLRRELEPPARILFVPPEVFWGVVRRGWRVLFTLGLDGEAFRLMSRVKYGRAVSAGDRRRTVSFARYQYPMARVFPHWNLKFAPEGFNEVQALFPAEGLASALPRLLAYCERHGRNPEVVAARRHRSDSYPLSFAGDGLSVTLPFSLAGFSATALDDYRRGLVDTILDHGGKVYLSKFPYLSRAAFRAMYPGWRRFLAVKERVDPERLFWSEAARRLFD